MSLKNKLLYAVDAIKVKAKHNAPEILLGVGIVGFTGTAVMASYLTNRDYLVAHEHSEEKRLIADQLEKGEIDLKEAKQMKRKENLHFAGQVCKTYWPAMLMGVGSSALLISSNRILRKRQAILIEALGTVTAAYASYREAIKEEIGEEREYELYRGVQNNSTDGTYVDEDGNVEFVKQTPLKDGTALFQFTLRPGDPGYDKTKIPFLTEGVESTLNNRLRAGIKTAEFANWVLDQFGQKPTALGQIAGWRAKDHFPVEGSNEDSNWIEINCFKRFEEVEMRGQMVSMPVWDIDFMVDGNVTDAL